MARGGERNPGHRTPDASRQLIAVVNPVVRQAKQASGTWNRAEVDRRGVFAAEGFACELRK